MLPISNWMELRGHLSGSWVTRSEAYVDHDGCRHMCRICRTRTFPLVYISPMQIDSNAQGMGKREAM